MPGVIDRMMRVPDVASIAALRLLESLLGRRCGGSTGTNLVGALELMAELNASGERGPVITLICDGGDRYSSTYYDEAWIASENLDLAGELARLNTVVNEGRWID
jgi:cysteine synthase A